MACCGGKSGCCGGRGVGDKRRGEFHLEEPFRAWLREAKAATGLACHADRALGAQVPQVLYATCEFINELPWHNQLLAEGEVIVFEAFTLEAMSGGLRCESSRVLRTGLSVNVVCSVYTKNRRVLKSQIGITGSEFR